MSTIPPLPPGPALPSPAAALRTLGEHALRLQESLCQPAWISTFDISARLFSDDPLSSLEDLLAELTRPAAQDAGDRPGRLVRQAAVPGSWDSASPEVRRGWISSPERARSEPSNQEYAPDESLPATPPRRNDTPPDGDSRLPYSTGPSSEPISIAAGVHASPPVDRGPRPSTGATAGNASRSASVQPVQQAAPPSGKGPTRLSQAAPFRQSNFQQAELAQPPAAGPGSHPLERTTVPGSASEANSLPPAPVRLATDPRRLLSVLNANLGEREQDETGFEPQRRDIELEDTSASIPKAASRRASSKEIPGPPGPDLDAFQWNREQLDDAVVVQLQRLAEEQFQRWLEDLELAYMRTYGVPGN